MLGFRTHQRNQEFIYFNEIEKRQIIEDYLQSGETKRSIWKKYTGRDREHGTMSRWMHELGYFSNREKSVFLVSEKASMQKEKNTPETPLEFENLQLQNRILELEKQLQESEMKAIAWRTMVEVAEQEFNISIKKKFNTKSSKK